MPITTRALVTGGAGFIGSNLADELIRHGAKVRIIDNFVTGNRETLEEISGDFSHPRSPMST
jgi:nucleoside-diphosphate-sugar epimerase